MNASYIPYYLSRAAITGMFCFGTMGLTLQAGIWSLALFSLFVIYLHSGWFSVDESKPLFPLRRDAFGLEVQRKALISATWVAILFSLLLKSFPGLLAQFPWLGVNIFGLGVVIYFLTQFYHFTFSNSKFI